MLHPHLTENLRVFSVPHFFLSTTTRTRSTQGMKFQSDYTYASIAHIDKIVTENNQTIQGAPDIRKAPD